MMRETGVEQPCRRASLPGKRLGLGMLLTVCTLAATCAHSKPAGPMEIHIPGERIYPESITASADGRLIIGSIGQQGIYVVDAGADTARRWIEADGPSDLGVLGVFADDRSNTLWACWAEIPALKGEKKPSALAAYDLKSGKQKARYTLPTAGALCNDIATTPNGSVYVTDSNNMEIDWMARGGGALTRWAGDGVFGAKGGLLDGISILGNELYVNTLVSGKLFDVPLRPDGRAGEPHEVTLDRSIQQPDGMRSFGKHSVLLVESGGTGRLSLLSLKGSSGQVTTLKEGFPDGPVSVAVVGRTGYVLEGQLKALFATGPNPPPPAPFRASAVPVGVPR
jgi:sugar lactone lactonase YvrE